MRPTKHSPSRSGSFTAIEARTRLCIDTNSTRWKNRMRTSAYGTPSPARSTRDGRARRDGLVKKPSAKWRSGSRIRFTTSAAHLAWSWERCGYCVTWTFRMTTSRSKRSEDTRDGPRRRDGRVPVSGKWPGAGWLNASAVGLSIKVVLRPSTSFRVVRAPRDGRRSLQSRCLTSSLVRRRPGPRHRGGGAECRPQGDFLPDSDVLCLFQVLLADDQGHQRHRDAPQQPDHAVPAGRVEHEWNQDRRPTKFSVTEVIRKREAGIADPRREHLDEEGGNRPVHHRDIEYLDEHEPDEDGDVRWFRERRHPQVQWIVRHDRERASEHDDFLSANPIGQMSPHQEKRCGKDERREHDDVGGREADPEGFLHE